MSFISRLLPREEKFHRFIEALCLQATLSARHLKTMVESKDEAVQKKAAQDIVACKAEAKRISSAVTRELCLSFITPFDREDIQDFSAELYKIPKTIDKVRVYLELHEVDGVEDLVAQEDLILQEAEAMESMVQALIKGGRTDVIMKQAALLDELENKGDDILAGLLVKLMTGTADTRQLILKRELYDLLERVVDRYRNAASIALQIALKNS